MAVSTLPRSTIVCSRSTAPWRRYGSRLALPGSPCHAVHVAFSSRAARTAAHSFFATTARKLSRRTTRTPGREATELSSTDTRRAPIAGGRRTRAWSMPGTDVILDVGVLAGALRGNVRPRRGSADDGVGGRSRERRLWIDGNRETAALNQAADWHRARRARRPSTVGRTGRADFAVDDRQIRGRYAEALRGAAQQFLSRARGGLADGGASAGQPGAAARAAVVRTTARITVDERDARNRDAELLGGHLRDGDAHPGADVDLAGEDGDAAVRVDGQEAIDFAARRAGGARRVSTGRSFA